MLLYWQCQAEPIFVSSDGKAARAAGLFPVVNGSGFMPVMRQQTGASERRQYNNRQEQVSTSNTTGRSRLAPAIQQLPGTGLLRRPPSVRRKGGARGGKAGFVTPSAFPPRKLAHAKVSPLERKRPPPGASVRRPTLYNIWYNFLIIFINNTIICIL